MAIARNEWPDVLQHRGDFAHDSQPRSLGGGQHPAERRGGRVGAVNGVVGWVLRTAQIPEEAHYHLNIAVEELVLNAIKHGRCSPSQGAIQIRLRLSGPELDITITDTGIPFNPLDAPPPDLTSSLADRPIGGLGIHLVRSLMNSVEYKRVGRGKPIALEKRLVGPNGLWSAAACCRFSLREACSPAFEQARNAAVTLTFRSARFELNKMPA